MSFIAVNARNQFRGRIRDIQSDNVVSAIEVELPDGQTVAAVITTRSVTELGLRVGSEVVAMVKSTEVAIATLD